MEPAEKLSITLPASLARFVREKVETGAYASNSEVIREALRASQERDGSRKQRLAEIRLELEEAMRDPRPGRPAKEVFDEIRGTHERKVKARRRGT